LVAWFAFAAGVFAGVGGLTHAGDKVTPYAVIDRALNAGGGTDKIKQFKAVSFKGEATIAGETMPIAGLFAGPRLFRLQMEPAKDGPLIMVASGDTIWAKKGADDLQEIHAGNAKELFQACCDLFYGIGLPDQLLALKDQAYKLTLVGEQQANGVQATVLRVNHELHPEALLFFDKETGLPVKVQLKLAKTQEAEIFFDDYKEVSEVKHFTKIRLRTGDKTLELVLREIQLLKKYDSAAFKKPA
jgi:hypothetical protein